MREGGREGKGGEEDRERGEERREGVTEDRVELAAAKESAHKRLNVDLVHGSRRVQPLHPSFVVDFALLGI